MTRLELRSGAGLACIWTQLGATQQYYPLVHTVFWVEHRLFGDSTLGYHLFNSLGLLLANRGRTNEALAHYRKALELNLYFVEAHNNIGIVHAKMGQFDEAMTHFLRALELKPESADTHYNLCILLANMGRTEDAKVHYQKALELNPDLARSQQ